MASANGDEDKTVELAPSGFDAKLSPRYSRSPGGGNAKIKKSNVSSILLTPRSN